MTDTYKPYQFQWTQESIENFWINARETEVGQNEFSKTAGPRFLDLIASYIKPEDQVFDFGCGSGYLMEALIKRGFHVSGTDVSSTSLQDTIQRLTGNPLFGGVNRPAPNQVFDVIIASEIFEHILEADLQDISQSWVHHLKPGGHLIITTPNAENLRNAKALCPSCGAIFHRKQHIRSVCHLDLFERFEKQLGLKRIHTGAYDFSSTRESTSLSLRYTRLQHTFSRQFQQKFDLILNAEKKAKKQKPVKELTRILSVEADKLIKGMIEEASLTDAEFDYVEGARNCLIYVAQKPIN